MEMGAHSCQSRQTARAMKRVSARRASRLVFPSATRRRRYALASVEWLACVKAIRYEGFTEGQARALVNNPGLEAAFRGERIDTFAKESAALDPRLEGIQITGRFRRGADFIDPVTGNWWDITTPGSWASHVLRYGLGGTMLPY